MSFTSNLQICNPIIRAHCTMLSADHTKWQWTLPPSHTTDANPEPQQLLLAYTSGDEPTIVQCCEAWFHYMGLVWGRHIIHIGPQEVTVYTGLWLMCMYTLYSPLSLVLYVQIHTYITHPPHITHSHTIATWHTHIFESDSWRSFCFAWLFLTGRLSNIYSIVNCLVLIGNRA